MGTFHIHNEDRRTCLNSHLKCFLLWLCSNDDTSAITWKFMNGIGISYKCDTRGNSVCSLERSAVKWLVKTHFKYIRRWLCFSLCNFYGKLSIFISPSITPYPTPLAPYINTKLESHVGSWTINPFPKYFWDICSALFRISMVKLPCFHHPKHYISPLKLC